MEVVEQGVAVGGLPDLDEKKRKVKHRLRQLISVQGLVLGVIALGVIIRFYYFSLTKNQAHWWDSLGYGSIAKQIVYGLWGDNAFLATETIIRPPLLPLLWSILIRFGASDVFSVFVFGIIPSVASVVFIYLLAKELYDTKVALAATFILSVLWIHLFYSMRVMTDVLSLCFALASLYCFMHKGKMFDSTWYPLSITLISFAILSRYFYGIVGALYIVFLIVIYGFSFLKKKQFWIGGIIGSIPLLLFFIYNIRSYGSLLPASSVYASSAAEKGAFAFYTFGFISHIMGAVLTVFFIIGMILMLFELVLGYDSIRKVKKLQSHFILVSLFIVSFVFFVFILRAAEDRYLFLVFPTLLAGAGYGTSIVYSFIKKQSKIAAAIVIIGLLGLGGYSELKYGDSIIVDKISSYKQMKDAFLWIKDQTPSTAVLVGDGIDLYSIYYAERKIISWNETTFDAVSAKADFVVIHRFEHQPDNAIQYVLANQTRFVPIHAEFFDSEQKQPAVIVYQIVK
ncbi:MAG TPA: glycosyltransferase family 39 protein [Candidatus Nanoarchaeia archaeon]|nr:glycosyltransferase family 39 protein [Candidatus Nanoarchaeia archaeon]